MNILSNQKGVSIIAVIAVMLILSVMGAALISLVTTGSNISINQIESYEAFNIADGGRDYIIEKNTFPNYYTPLSIALGDGSFTVTTPTWLTADIDAAVINFNVYSTGAFASAGRIIIDSELVDYTGTTANSFTGATRGVGGTTAAAHVANNSVYPVTILTADPGAAGVFLNVSSTTGFVTPGVVTLESEYIYCSDATAKTFTSCQRGFNATAAAAHAVGSNVFQYIVTSKGTSGTAQRVVRVAVDDASSSTEYISDGSFLDSTTFSSFSNWSTEVLSQSWGSSFWNMSSHTSGSGSLKAITVSAKDESLEGYREQDITNITAGTPITLDMWFEKEFPIFNKKPQTYTLEVQLVYTDATIETPSKWNDTLKTETSGWDQLPSQAQFATFTPTKDVDKVRLYFNIQNNKNTDTWAAIWFDEVSLTTSTTTTNVLDFREIY